MDDLKIYPLSLFLLLIKTDTSLIKKRGIFILIIAIVLSLTACSSPKKTSYDLKTSLIKAERSLQYQQALTYQLAQRIRLAEVSQILLQASVKDCANNTQYSLGIFLHSIDSYDKKQQAAALTLYDLSDTPQILHVLSNGASKNIFKSHDKILKINGKQAPKDTKKTLQAIQQTLSRGDQISFDILRGNQFKKIQILPKLVCAYPVVYSNSDTINGYADGSRIIITAGLMRFTKNDNELALIIAHEMAHNTLHHIQQRLKNTALGGLIDIALISSGVFSPFVGAGLGGNIYTQSYEIEADLEGLRLLHQAGIDINGLDNFWRKLASIHPSTISQGKEISHPTTVERALLIEAEIQRLLSTNTTNTL